MHGRTLPLQVTLEGNGAHKKIAKIKQHWGFKNELVNFNSSKAQSLILTTKIKTILASLGKTDKLKL